QMEFNQAHGITPTTIVKSVDEILRSTSVADAKGQGQGEELKEVLTALEREDPQALIARLETEMLTAARALDFERAASLRDRTGAVRRALPEAARSGVGGVPVEKRRPPNRTMLRESRRRR